jgi:DNA-binding GntR family transcriptional regulator
MRRAPLYRRLADTLRAALSSGEIAVGEQLPTELELCARHGVSRHTARDALRLLAEEGLIARKRGAGTVATAPRVGGPFTQAWGGVGDILHYARDARLRLGRMGPATGEDLAIMGLDPAVAWRCLSGERWAPGGAAPLAATRICVRADLMPAREAIESWDGAIAELIGKRTGVVAARIEQEIAAVALDRAQARRLDARAGSPALRTVRRYLDAAGAPFQASLSLHPADRFTYSMVVER